MKDFGRKNVTQELIEGSTKKLAALGVWKMEDIVLGQYPVDQIMVNQFYLCSIIFWTRGSRPGWVGTVPAVAGAVPRERKSPVQR